MFLFIFNFLPIDQASLAFNGSAGAPLVGVFILGACFTSSNWVVSACDSFLFAWTTSFVVSDNQETHD